jgi:hypothetical protein
MKDRSHWVVSDDKPSQEDLRSSHLRTKLWPETQIPSSSKVLLKEKEKHRGGGNIARQISGPDGNSRL